MKYYFVKWFHDFEDEPFEMYHEVNMDLEEIRKIEIFKDKIGVACAKFNTNETILSDQVFLSINEINSESQFFAVEISRSDFEQKWEQSVKKNGLK